MRYFLLEVLVATLILYHAQINGEEPPPPAPTEAAAPPPAPAEAAAPPPPPATTPPPSTNPPEPPGPPGPAPVQTLQKCQDLRPLITAEYDFTYDVNAWVVGRITILKDPGQLDIKTNICSTFSYVDGCGALHYNIFSKFSSMNNTATVSKEEVGTFGYFTPTDNIVHYTETFNKEDTTYEIWKAKIDLMEYIGGPPEHKTTPVPNIPEPVRKIHEEKEFACVAVDKEGKWIIHRVCESETTWVSFRRLDIFAEPDPKVYMDKFKADIDKHLTDMKLDPNIVIPIETKFKSESPAISSALTEISVGKNKTPAATPAKSPPETPPPTTSPPATTPTPPESPSPSPPPLPLPVL